MIIPYYEMPLLSVDTETTGVNPHQARVVTCNFTYHYLDKEPYICNWLINPEIEIPTGASDVHGITTEYAQQYGRNAKECLIEIANHLDTWESYNLPLVVYNASYDLTLLINEFKRHGIQYNSKFDKVIDPLVLDKALDKYRKGKRQLTITAAYYGIQLENAHTAEADSLASVLVARAIGKMYNIDSPIEEVFSKQKQFKAEQAESLEKYFRTSKNDPTICLSREWPYETIELERKD